VRKLKREFGEGFKRFLITGQADSVAEAEEVIRAAEV
jgi:hypothetical protein